jgi:hypothetical protein
MMNVNGRDAGDLAGIVTIDGTYQDTQVAVFGLENVFSVPGQMSNGPDFQQRVVVVGGYTLHCIDAIIARKNSDGLQVDHP